MVDLQLFNIDSSGNRTYLGLCQGWLKSDKGVMASFGGTIYGLDHNLTCPLLTVKATIQGKWVESSPYIHSYKPRPQFKQIDGKVAWPKNDRKIIDNFDSKRPLGYDDFYQVITLYEYSYSCYEFTRQALDKRERAQLDEIINRYNEYKSWAAELFYESERNPYWWSNEKLTPIDTLYKGRKLTDYCIIKRKGNDVYVCGYHVGFTSQKRKDYTFHDLENKPIGTSQDLSTILELAGLIYLRDNLGQKCVLQNHSLVIADKVKIYCVYISPHNYEFIVNRIDKGIVDSRNNLLNVQFLVNKMLGVCNE